MPSFATLIVQAARTAAAENRTSFSVAGPRSASSGTTVMSSFFGGNPGPAYIPGQRSGATKLVATVDLRSPSTSATLGLDVAALFASANGLALQLLDNTPTRALLRVSRPGATSDELKQDVARLVARNFRSPWSVRSVFIA